MRCGLLAACLAAALPATGGQLLFRLDPSATAVEFTLPASLHTVHGSFKPKRGEIRFDPAAGTAAGEIVVDAASGDSGNRGRDSRMHRNVLESGTYPEIAFLPDRLEGAIAQSGDSTVRLHGKFRIHGAEHDLSIPVKVRIENDRLTGSADFSVPYVKWGMKNPSNLFLRVSDTVGIHIRFAGRIETARPPD